MQIIPRVVVSALVNQS